MLYTYQLDKETMKQLQSWLKNVTVQAEYALLFLISFAFASIFGSIVGHRNSDPYNIDNTANLGFEANYFRIILFVVFGFIFFFLLLSLRKHRPNLVRPVVTIMITAVVLVNILIPLPTQQIDMFHNGEQLAPAFEYKEGAKLFSDLFFLHGAGEDILIPNLAFHLLNGGSPSIGSYLLIYKILQALTVLILLLLLSLVLKHRLAFLLALTWIAGSIFLYNGLGSGKYIFLYLVLALYYKFLVEPPAKKYLRNIIAISIGVLSSASLFYSIEVGVVLVALNLVVLVGLVLAERTAAGFKLDPSNIKHLKSYKNSLLIAVGWLVVQLIGAIVLNVPTYLQFLKQTFSDIPKYQSALFSYGSPVFQGDIYSYGFWLPIILLPILILMFCVLVVRQYRPNKTVTHRVIFAGVLLLACLATLRSGVGRPDFFHMATAAMPFFVAGFYITEEFIMLKRVASKNGSNTFAWLPILFIGLLLWPQTTWNIETMIVTRESSKKTASDILSVSSRPDSDWLNDEQKSVVKYITSNSSKNDGLFVFTAEPLYYYLTDRKNPSRFTLTWFADPQAFTNELLASLKAKPPKYIIYSGPALYDNIDGIKIQDRVPEVNKWILDNYPIKTTIDKTLILSKE